MFCSKCGAANNQDARFCRACAATLLGGASPAQLVIAKPTKSPGMAAVLSFFICGLGQIYNGQVLKGLLSIIAEIISVSLISVVIGLIAGSILWIWGIVDAYKTAERLNSAAIEGIAPRPQSVSDLVVPSVLIVIQIIAVAALLFGNGPAPFTYTLF